MNRRASLKLAAAAGMAASSSSILAQEKPRPLRILILGGTGFTGPYQVRYALSRGHKITLFNRGRRPQDWPAEVEELTGDRDKGDLKSLEGREWDVCIDNPAGLPSWVRDAGKVLAGKVKHYVFISTVSVYRDSSKPGRDESTPLENYEGPDAMAETRQTLGANMALYGPLKAESEREAEKQFPGITTIIRPGLIVGPGDETDRFTYWPVRIAKGGEILAPPADDPVQVIDARDLAEWTIRMVEQRTLGVFNACGPEKELGMGKMLEEIRSGVKPEAKLVHVTTEFLQKQKVMPWGDLPCWVPGQGDSAGFSRTSNERAVKAGLTFRPVATTAADALAWFNNQPAERKSKFRAGLTEEREAEVLKAWGERK
ncbi:epimerase [Luteolibacter luteus]|uniref:Epimerase n=1 Tax=Luteolibacter luteus TaxID=2728835 RepID=A0A858RLJ6_9BACT|nr:epimerase [Luteolibacter luteus]QJE97605.1 epimerase [Luteolibacter luteus]